MNDLQVCVNYGKTPERACKPGIVRPGVGAVYSSDFDDFSPTSDTGMARIGPPSPVPHEESVSHAFPAPVLTLPAYYLEPDLDAPLICPDQLDRRSREMVCRDEDGTIVKRFKLEATWCPHGRPFRVARPC